MHLNEWVSISVRATPCFVGILSFVGKLPYGLCQDGVLGPSLVGNVATTIGFDRAPHARMIFVKYNSAHSAAAVKQYPSVTISLPFEL